MAAKAGRASAVVDVFISYAREDRDRAIGLVDALERAGRTERINDLRQSGSEVRLQPVRRGEGASQ